MSAPLAPWLPDRLIEDDRYRQSLDWLYSLSLAQRPLDQSLQRARKTERMQHLLALLGHPEGSYPSVLVVGTKGKGSTAAILAEILREAGLHVGRYTQPHLLSWCERTWVDGWCISPSQAAQLLEEVRPTVERLHRDAPYLGRLTTFEVGTAVALLHFARCVIDLAVIEAGVGGAGDVGNLTQVGLAVLTPVSLDHVEVLGDSVAQIAREKAGVIRSRGMAVSAPQPAEARWVVRAIAAQRQARLWEVGEDWRWTAAPGCEAGGAFDLAGPSQRWGNLLLPLLGRHQRDNATVAVAAASMLEQAGFRIPSAAISRGLAAVEWPGRLQVLAADPSKPLGDHAPSLPGGRPALFEAPGRLASAGCGRIVVDGAHNADSAQRLAQALRDCFAFQRLVLVLGMTSGKDVAGVVQPLAAMADRTIATRSAHPRALAPAELKRRLASLGYQAEAAPNIDEALATACARAGPDDLVCVAGSLFLVGEVLERVQPASLAAARGGGGQALARAG